MTTPEWIAWCIGWLLVVAVIGYAQRGRRKPERLCTRCYQHVDSGQLCADCVMEIARGY